MAGRGGKSLSHSDQVCLFEQIHEWADLHRGGILESRFSEASKGPELKPVKVVRSLLDVVFVAVMLEVKHLVTPL